jgi:O-antigen ligase
MSAPRHSRSRRELNRHRSIRERFPVLTETWQFYLLASFLVIVFLIGGDGSSDSVFAGVIWSGAILVGSLGLTTLTTAQVRAHLWLFVIAAMCLGLAILQLVPLPPRVFLALGHRDLVMAVDQAVGLEGQWRPMNLDPISGWHGLWSAAPALATLILAVQMDSSAQRKLVGVFLTLGFLSAGIGLLQILDDPNGPLYWHRVRHIASANGLFANRNHQAALLACLFPMLAAWSGWKSGDRRPEASQRVVKLPIRRLVAIIGGLLLVPMILITGSRSGLLAGVIGLCSVPLLLNARREKATSEQSTFPLTRPTRLATVLFGLVSVMLAAATILLGRAEAWRRLFGMNPLEDPRVKIQPSVYAMIQDYFPWGSGFGSFATLYQVYEPDLLLMPPYMNQVHNDWLDVILTGGLPALVILSMMFIAWMVRARRILTGSAHSRSTSLPRAGLIVLAMFALASLTDYPLRIPSLECLFICAAVWMVREEKSVAQLRDHRATE